MAQDLDALLERRKKLQEQIEEVDERITEQKKGRISELVAELKELGYNVDNRKKRSASDRDPSSVTCQICKITGHDARSHRGQGDKKRPFTKEELRDKGLPTG